MPASNRARRFSLPDLADERVEASISSFLDGPQHRRGRREPFVAVGTTANPLAGLETRIAWVDALRRESARSARYRRPAAVMVIAAEPTNASAEAGSWLGRMAGPIAQTVHRGLRETDLVTRTGDARFQVLLPETTAPEAATAAERVVGECRVWLEAARAPLTIRAASAATASDTTLDMALERALRALDPVRPA